MLLSLDSLSDRADSLDRQFATSSRRDNFHLPQHNGRPAIYFTGNSLGLQPKNTQELVLEELEDWAQLGVEGHFHGRRPWFAYHKHLTEATARLVGALPHEVVVMNNLTVNLHLLLVTFYRPSSAKYRVLMEASAFPSDQYAIESQVRWHGFTPEDAILELSPVPGSYTVDTEDILRTIRDHRNSLALVMLSGVQYYTGQWFDMQAIAAESRKYGIVVGFDLAHAAGNVPMQLHDWEVDFACWCTYKYLNSGPGGTSGVFIHERHVQDTSLPRFAGWWGHSEEERFKMQKGFKAIPTAEGWQLSNAQILPMAAHLAALKWFDELGMEALRAKSMALTGFAVEVLQRVNAWAVAQGMGEPIRLITPLDPAQRGAQLSLLVPDIGRRVFEKLSAEGVVADWREPDVIRVAPVPLYNTFEEVYRFGVCLQGALEQIRKG
jgi:kynureninase